MVTVLFIVPLSPDGRPAVSYAVAIVHPEGVVIEVIPPARL